MFFFFAPSFPMLNLFITSPGLTEPVLREARNTGQLTCLYIS